MSTLRAWERRFGLLQPERSPSRQRLYTEADVERVAAVGRLLSEGLTLSAAATRVSVAGPAVLPVTEREALLLHQAVQAVAEGIWVSKEGRTRFVNRRMAELMGCTTDELMDRSIYDFVDPGWLDAAQGHIDRLRAGHRERYELGLLRPDGSTFVAEVDATPLRDNAGQYDGAVAVINDVSDRAAAEAETAFRTAALDAIGEAVIAARPDARIVYANPAVERLLGWRPAELLGRNGLELLPQPDATETARRVHAELLAAKRQSGEMRLVRRDGTYFPAHITTTPITDAKGDLIAFVAVIRDDSERLRLEQDIRSHEQQAEIAAMLGSRVLRQEPAARAELLPEIVDACRRALGADGAALLDVVAAGEGLPVRITSPDRKERAVAPSGSRSIAGYTALAGKVVIVEDAGRDRRFDLPPAPSWRGPVTSAIGAPVMGPSGVCGVLLACWMDGPQQFSPSAPHFVESVANVIGTALQPT